MRIAKLGCGVLAGLMALSIAILLLWTLMPPKLTVPPRRYPPDNAYPYITAIALQLSQLEASNPRIKELSRRASTPGGALTPSEHQEYAHYVQPFLRAYRKYLFQPSKVVLDYNPAKDPTFHTNTALRELARAEGYFIRWALANNRQAEAIERATALAQLSNQISQDGALIHYLVGRAIRMIALEPVRRELPHLHQRAALEQLLRWAKQEEQNRPKLTAILQTEHYIGRTMLMEAYRNPEPVDPAQAPWWARYTLPARFMVKTAVSEYERAMAQIKAYAAKPAWQRQPSDYPRVSHPLNEDVISIFEETIQRYEASVALTRLLGCVAAVRLHKIRTGHYPASLEQLNLGELAIDPFTGKPFVYRVDRRQGFLIYSVGANRIDEGGRFHYHLWDSTGDIVPVSVPRPTYLRGEPALWPLADPVWLR